MFGTTTILPRVGVCLLWLATWVAAPASASLETAVERCWTVAVDDAAAALELVSAAFAEHGVDVGSAAAAELGLCRGYAYEQLGEVEHAAQEYQRAVEAGEALGDTRLLASALAQRGELAYYRGEFSASLEDLDHAYRLELEVGREDRQRYVLNAIANVYSDVRVAAYDRALEYYRQIQSSHEAAGRLREVATGHFNIGSTLERMGDLPGALAEFEKAVEIDRRRGDRDEIAFNERALAGVLVKLGRAREALPRLDAAVAHFAAIREPEHEAQAQLTRAIAHRALGNFAAALADLAAAAERFQRSDNDRYLARIFEEQAECHAARGDLAAAFRARSDQVALERKLAELHRNEHTSHLRVKFDADKKEQENRALARENELRGEALRAAERIRRLERAILGLALGLVGLLGVLVFRQVVLKRRLQTLAMTDELTRLPNRRSFFARAGEMLADAVRFERPLTLVAFDLDHFKRVNDQHGHEVGDRVLQRVAHAATSALRVGDLVGRTGGEEFLALLPDADHAAAAEVAERLRGAVERLDWQELTPGLVVTLSVGVAVRQRGETEFAALARRADVALYRAKQAGRNRVEIAPAGGLPDAPLVDSRAS